MWTWLIALAIMVQPQSITATWHTPDRVVVAWQQPVDANVCLVRLPDSAASVMLGCLPATAGAQSIELGDPGDERLRLRAGDRVCLITPATLGTTCSAPLGYPARVWLPITVQE